MTDNVVNDFYIKEEARGKWYQYMTFDEAMARRQAKAPKIDGKRDTGRHEGKRSEVRRQQSANFDLLSWLHLR
jgi:hypothetical protein